MLVGRLNFPVRRIDATLAAWSSEARCARHFGDLVKPDAYGRWATSGGEIEFFLEYDFGTEVLAKLAGKLVGYANLAVRGLRMHEIRVRQLEPALALHPDLMTVFGGMNYVIAPRVDFDAIRAEHVIVFGEARRDGCTVLTATPPPPGRPASPRTRASSWRRTAPSTPSGSGSG